MRIIERLLPLFRLTPVGISCFMRWRYSGLLTVFSLLASHGLSSVSYANSHFNCDAYAKSAVLQQQQNIDLECKFEGEIWSFDYQAHYDWCNTGAPADDLTINERTRSEALGQCFDTKAMMCQGYADGALQAYHFGIQRECGFDDALVANNLVANDYEGHFDWCIQAPHIEVQGAISQRDALVQQCKTTLGQ